MPRESRKIAAPETHIVNFWKDNTLENVNDLPKWRNREKIQKFAPIMWIVRKSHTKLPSCEMRKRSVNWISSVYAIKPNNKKPEQICRIQNESTKKAKECPECACNIVKFWRFGSWIKSLRIVKLVRWRFAKNSLNGADKTYDLDWKYDCSEQRVKMIKSMWIAEVVAVEFVK